MKIIDKIIGMEIKNSEDRLNKLKEVGGVPTILEALAKNIEELKKGRIKISDKKELGSQEYIDHKVLKGSGGKIFIQFNGYINYFPQGKFGPFLTKAAGARPEEKIRIKSTKVFTTKEAAEILGITPQQLRKKLRISGIEKDKETGKYTLTSETIDSLK